MLGMMVDLSASLESNMNSGKQDHQMRRSNKFNTDNGVEGVARVAEAV